MFFILSKTIGALTKPFGWLVILMLAAVFLRKTKAKKVSLIAAFTVFLVFTNPVLFDFSIKCWEPEPVAVENLRTYDIGIVLGGFSSYLPEYNNIKLNEAGDRLWQTVSLYNRGKIKKILISGGSGRKTGKSEAAAVRDVLIAMGIPESDVLAESESRNTYENAEYSAKLIAGIQPGADCLLITSALHIPRSIGCFCKAGLNPDIFPAEHISRYEDTFWLNRIVPKPEVMVKWNRLINEWVGMLVYKVQGYI